MTFTIVCAKCGNEQIFTNGDRRWQENIEIEVEIVTIDSKTKISHLTIYCENEKCNNWIDINY